MENRNKTKINNSYDNYNQSKPICKSDFGRNQEELNDNLSEKANSVQTSYKYKKNKNGPNTISSKESFRNNPNNYNNNIRDDDLSIEISENDNLICPNCINCTLIEEKQRREELDRERDRERDRKYDYGTDYNSGLYDRNRNYDQNLINEKRRQRENNTNEAIQNLAKINAGLSNKDKLIQINENSRNPLNDGLPDYQYQRFQDEYERRQKMINDNIDKYYPNMSNERPEIKRYYDNYVYNPKYNGNRNEGYDSSINQNRDYGRPGQGQNQYDRRQYYKDLEDQINYKNELKKREKEEERRRGQRQFEDIQRELKREDEERMMKERKKMEELIKANNELINQKNKMKLKDLEDKLKYRELCDRQNEEYQRDLHRQQLEKERMKDDIYNHNKNEQMRREREKERERDREKEMYDDRKYGEKYGGDYDNKRGGKYDERYGGKYDDKYGGKYDDKYGYRDDLKYAEIKDIKDYGKIGNNQYDNRGDRRYDNRGEGNLYDHKYDDRRGYGRNGDGYGKGGDRYGRGEEGYDKGGDIYGKRDGYGNRADDGYGNKGQGGYGKGDRNDDKGFGGQGKRKERMGRCCRCHRIFPRRLLTINRYFYKENRK